MKRINYEVKKEREIAGLFYVFNSKNIEFLNQSGIDGVSVVFSPEHYIVKPALDYLRFMKSGGSNKEVLRKVATSICHYYNFCRLHKINVENELTNDVLKGYIKYLSSIPKNVWMRVKKHPSNVSFLPVHPYINDNEKSISKIYAEWYNYWLHNEENIDVQVLYNPASVKYEEDKKLWMYDYEFIEACVKNTLEYLTWLNKSISWQHRFKPIKEEVARRTLKLNYYNHQYNISWNVGGRIKEVTNLKASKQSSVRRRRVFYETELIKLLNAKMLNQHSQRKLLFMLLLLTGCRISECLNLLVKNLRITIKDKYNPFGIHTIVHWEDMFDEPYNEDDMDLLIDKYLGFSVRVAKRRAYETRRRSNKSEKTRITPLRDYFELPGILGLNSMSIFVEPQDVFEAFQNEIVLEKKEANPYKVIEEVMHYTNDQKAKGINTLDDRFDKSCLYRIEKIRKLIENSSFGGLLRHYLIERQLLFTHNRVKNYLDNHFLFINMKINKCSPMIGQTIEKYWLDPICREHSIQRASYIPNKILKHSYKKNITLHSFRHTYISARITILSKKGEYNDALLKHEVGHRKDSTIAETTYFFSDAEKIKEAQTIVFKHLRSRLEKISLKEDVSSNDKDDVKPFTVDVKGRMKWKTL